MACLSCLARQLIKMPDSFFFLLLNEVISVCVGSEQEPLDTIDKTVCFSQPNKR